MNYLIQKRSGHDELWWGRYETKMRKVTVNKPWGSFIRFTLNEKSTVKILVVKPGEMLSLQSHTKRTEFWYVLQGRPSVVLNSVTKKYKQGDSIRISKGIKHRISNKTKRIVKILEIAEGKFSEKDIVRYKDKYDRIKK